MKEIHFCEVCGTSYGIEMHHRVFRSECKPLERCKLNHVYLCSNHHRGTYGVHGREGNKLNRKLKLELQNKLEMLFDKRELTEEEINEVLQISEKALQRPLKTLTLHKGKYVREDVIRACLGGKLIEGVKE